MKITKVPITLKTLKVLDYLDRMTFPVDDPYPKEPGHWWLAIDKEGPAGFAGLDRIGDHTAFLSRIGVFQRLAGQGVGRALIRAVEKCARKQGYDTIVSHTLPDNYKSANNLILSGYRLIKPMPWFHYKGALHFRKEL